jgi:hypothetical protein
MWFIVFWFSIVTLRYSKSYLTFNGRAIPQIIIKSILDCPFSFLDLMFIELQGLMSRKINEYQKVWQGGVLSPMTYICISFRCKNNYGNFLSLFQGYLLPACDTRAIHACLGYIYVPDLNIIYRVSLQRYV